MPSSRQLTCPACQTPLDHERQRPPFECRHCGSSFTFSTLPLWLGLPLSFVLSMVVVQILGLKAYAALLWLPILFVSLAVVLPVTASLLPARMVELGPSARSSGSYKRTLVLFLTWWLTCVFIAVTYGFSAGWLAALLRAPRQDIAVLTDMWSFPLGLINPSFIIRPERSLAEVLGIVTANCYFCALALTFVFKIVHGFIKRSRVTQLGISTTTIDDDDEL
jgi:uncharacterized protein (DUF983 family)